MIFRSDPVECYEKIIPTSKAPPDRGSYSQAVQLGNQLFVSGTNPIDPASGQLVQSNIAVQTTRVLENIKLVVESAGMSLEDALKDSCFLENMEDFTRFKAV